MGQQHVGDLLLVNAHIWTGVASAPWAEAALIREERFVAVGTTRSIDSPRAIEVVDAAGHLVVPGLIDGHAHLLGTGAAMRSVDLKGSKTAKEAARRVAARVAAAAPGAWIRGAGWDQNDWPEARFPHKRDLDAIAPDHPVYLAHTSGHCSWVNTAALRAANITRATTSPPGGAIDIDADGEPTGILRDSASRLVTDVAPNPTQTERIDAVQDAIAHAHSLGVTGVHAMDVGRGELQAMYALHDAAKLRLRVRPFLSATRLDEWVDRNITTGDGDDMLRIGGVKFFADGALGSLTAWMFEPYEDSTAAGFPLQPIEELEQQVRRCLEHGLAPAIHAIGDRANHEVLDLIERHQALAPELPRRIEHAQLLKREDIARFGALGISASMQPIHATQDMRKVDRSWGARGEGAYIFASLLASGARVAFGSDTPVETIDPIAGIHAAVTRQSADGVPAGGWHPAQKISVDAALSAYASGCAYAAGEHDVQGKIAPGYCGDFVMLSENMFTLDDPGRITECRAIMTVVGGDVVHRA